MNKIRAVWSAELPPIPEAQLAEIKANAVPALYEAAACFWIFRFLHRVETPAAVLTGDYCFGRFSHHLAALDDVALTDAFAAYLREDTLRPKDFGDYLAFLRGLSPDTGR